MNRIDDRHLPWLALEEKRLAIEEFQKRSVDNGIIPDTRMLFMHRYGRTLQMVGGMLLGGLVAVTTMLITFILFNVLIHI